MLLLLENLNIYVGKFVLDEVLDLTPIEATYILSGGQKRELNRLQGELLLSNAVKPVILVDNAEEINQTVLSQLQKQQDDIKAITDEKMQQERIRQTEMMNKFTEIFG